VALMVMPDMNETPPPCMNEARIPDPAEFRRGVFTSPRADQTWKAG
jgi:hypothetical protein